MKLYSSLSGTVDPFTPGDDVQIYVCGITPYDTTHLGHAFTYTVNDILIRYLEYKGNKVTYVQNVTDIDDDILRKARESGEDWQALGNRWTAHFIKDMQTLNVRPPDYYPRATEFIPEIIAINQRLLDEGLAYERDGNLYYHVDAWSEFGKLSKLEREEMLPIANERGNVPDDQHKRDPLDFVLWQAQKPGEPAWKSPWGAGRPGWHIECSAMASHLLGPTIDIHSGGGDLIFPHHECEIAQLEPVTGQQPFVRFWLHAAMVYHEGEKMSKSLGNLIMCRDLLRSISPDTLRVYLGKHHYRQAWSFDDDELNEASELADLLRLAGNELSGNGLPFDPQTWETAFRVMMDDDLNTPGALQTLSEMASDMLAAGRAGQNLRPAQKALRAMAGVFGLRLGAVEPDERVIVGWETHLRKFLG